MKNAAKRWLKFIVSAVLLVVLLTQIDFHAVLQSLSGVKWISQSWVALALFIGRVYSLLPFVDPSQRARHPRAAAKADVALFVSSFFNTVLPTGFGGDVVKSAELAHTSGHSGEAVGAVVMDRFLGIVALLAMGVAALLVAGEWVNSRITRVIAILFVALLAGFWLLRQRWLMQRLSQLIPQRLRRPILSFSKALYNGLQGYSGRTLAQALAVSFLFNITWVAVNMALGWSLGIQASLAQYLVFVPLVSLSLLVPSVGGLGVRELTYVGLFALIGVPRNRLPPRHPHLCGDLRHRPDRRPDLSRPRITHRPERAPIPLTLRRILST